MALTVICGCGRQGNRTMKRTILLLVPIVFAAVAQACSAQTDPSCLTRWQARNSEWRAISFVDSSGRVTPLDQEGKAFSPIQRLLIVDGIVYAQTWGGEPLPAQTKVAGKEIVISPRYLAWLGRDDDAIGIAAHRVLPYARPSVVHIMEFQGQCSSPTEIVLKIEERGTGAKGIGVVKLRKN